MTKNVGARSSVLRVSSPVTGPGIVSGSRTCGGIICERFNLEQMNGFGQRFPNRLTANDAAGRRWEGAKRHKNRAPKQTEKFNNRFAISRIVAGGRQVNPGNTPWSSPNPRAPAYN